VLNAAKALFDQEGPQIAERARNRAPISKERNFNPNPSSFKPISLRPSKEFGLSDADTRFRRAELESILAETRGNARLDILRSSDFQFFQGRENKRTPDAINIRRGGLVGAFKHQPGTLKKSIKYVGTRREGNTVVGVVEAGAPHAAAIEDGFRHFSHGKATGTKVPAQPYLNPSLKQSQGEFFDSTKYRVR
jgi:hypothetical protein